MNSIGGKQTYITITTGEYAKLKHGQKALLVERDALREALIESARVIALDRQSLRQCHENPKTGEVDDGLGREGLREYDHALELARVALHQ